MYKILFKRVVNVNNCELEIFILSVDKLVIYRVVNLLLNYKENL